MDPDQSGEEQILAMSSKACGRVNVCKYISKVDFVSKICMSSLGWRVPGVTCAEDPLRLRHGSPNPVRHVVYRKQTMELYLRAELGNENYGCFFHLAC